MIDSTSLSSRSPPLAHDSSPSTGCDADAVPEKRVEPQLSQGALDGLPKRWDGPVELKFRVAMPVEEDIDLTDTLNRTGFKVAVPPKKPIKVSLFEGVHAEGPRQTELPEANKITFAFVDPVSRKVVRTSSPHGYVYATELKGNVFIPNGSAHWPDGEVIVCADLALHDSLTRQQRERAMQAKAGTGEKVPSQAALRRVALGSAEAVARNVPATRAMHYLTLMSCAKKMSLVSANALQDFLFGQCAQLKHVGDSVQLDLETGFHALAVQIKRKSREYAVTFYDPNSLGHWRTTCTQREHLTDFSVMVRTLLEYHYGTEDPTPFHMFTEVPKDFLDDKGELNPASVAKSYDDVTRSLSLHCAKGEIPGPSALGIVARRGLPLRWLDLIVDRCKTVEQRMQLLDHKTDGRSLLADLMSGPFAKRVVEFIGIVRRLLAKNKLAPEDALTVLDTRIPSGESALWLAASGMRKASSPSQQSAYRAAIDAWMQGLVLLMRDGTLDASHALALVDPAPSHDATQSDDLHREARCAVAASLVDAICKVPKDQLDKRDRKEFVELLTSLQPEAEVNLGDVELSDELDRGLEHLGAYGEH